MPLDHAAFDVGLDSGVLADAATTALFGGRFDPA